MCFDRTLKKIKEILFTRSHANKTNSWYFSFIHCNAMKCCNNYIAITHAHAHAHQHARIHTSACTQAREHATYSWYANKYYAELWIFIYFSQMANHFIITVHYINLALVFRVMEFNYTNKSPYRESRMQLK